MFSFANVMNGVINHEITTGFILTEGGHINAYCELVITAARKRYVSGYGFLFKTLSSTQFPLQDLEVCNGNV